MKTNYKRIKLPKGKVRAKIVELDKSKPVSQEEYDKIVEEDFESCRANYVIVFMYNVPVYVKVVDESQQGTN